MASNLTEAREYLARVLPWVEGYWTNVHYSFTGKDGKKHWGGRACKTVSEAVNQIEYQLKQAGTLDVYACQSTQTEAIEKLNKNKQPFYNAKRSSNNAVDFRSLFMDLDLKNFGSHSELINSLINFLTISGMPPPTVKVFTGGGYHFYWVLDETIPRDQWQVLADALSEAIQQHFTQKVDVACTIDAARILRIPDTFNRKTDKELPVRFAGPRLDFNYSVERISNILAPYKLKSSKHLKQANGVAYNFDPSLFPVRPPLAPGIEKLGMGVEPQGDYPLTNISELIPECGFIKEALTTGGKDYDNGLWNLTTYLATFTSDGFQNACLMARKHKDYTKETTEVLYERKLRERSGRDFGWPNCKTLSTSGSVPCKTCPHLVKDKTPFHFRTPPHATGSPVQGLSGSGGTLAPLAPVAASTDLPHGYRRDVNGMVQKEQKSDEDEGESKYVLICDYPLEHPWLQANPYGLHFRTHTHKEVQIFILAKDIGSTEMRKILQDQLLMLHTKQVPAMGEFLVSWLQKLREIKDSVISTEAFGWNIKGGSILGFVYGGTLWTPTGDKPAPTPDPEILAQYSPTGSRDPWIKAAKLVTEQNRPELNAIIAASFAAPLVRFSGHDGFLLSVWSSKSGIGKTTAMRIGQAVWGHPVTASQSLGDTSNSVFNKMGILKSIPLFYDEIKTQLEAQKFVRDIFQLTQGKERSRLNSNIKLRKVGTWQTLLVAASNESLADFIASRTKTTEAGTLRIFEAEAQPSQTGRISVGDAQLIISDLNDNFGQIGLEYAKYLGVNHALVKEKVAATYKELESLITLPIEERFWIGLVSVLLTAVRLINELGYATIDEPSFIQWLIDTLNANRGNRDASSGDMSKVINVSDNLAQFLSSMGPRHLLKTNKIWVSAGKPPVNAIKVIGNRQFTDAVLVHIGVEDKLIRISSAALTEWCKEMELPRQPLTRGMEQKFGSKKVNGRLGSGTSFATMTQYLIEIDGGQIPELEELFNV